MQKKSNKKVLMLWTGNNNKQFGGVGYYRIVSPAKKLIELGYDIDIVSGFDIIKLYKTGKHTEEIIDVYSNMLEKYDLIWMKSTDNKDAIAALFSMKDKFNCKIVWDFDDDVFNVRESQPAYKELYKGSDKKAIIATAISYCDALTVSTEYLKKSLSKMLKEVYNIDKEIFVCPNFENKEEWNNVKYHPSNSPIIGYYGSITHNDDFELIKPVMYKILEKYPLVRFEILGALSTSETIVMFADCPKKEMLCRIGLNGGTSGWDGFPELLLNQRWDIALAPLIDDEFNRSKSNIKWMETAMKSIPCICSDVEPYKTTVTRETGILCKTQDDWFNALCLLIENPDLRVKIGKNAKKYILNNYTDKIVEQWNNTLSSLIK